MITLNEADGEISREGRGQRLEKSNGLSEVRGGEGLEEKGGWGKRREDCSMGCVCMCSMWFGLTDYVIDTCMNHTTISLDVTSGNVIGT